jgi:hypothetical protein
MVDYSLTTDNKKDKYPMIESAGHLTREDVIDLMREEDTGLRRETIEHVMNLENRVVTKAVLNGNSVNTGLFRAVAQPRGIIKGGQWDPERNSIYVSFTQDKDIREAIAETSIDILGNKQDVMFIAEGEDGATRATDGAATAGRNYILRGRMLKVTGDDPSVGITLTNTAGKVTKLPADLLTVNNPSQLIFLLPADLADGEYTITVTTQYLHTNALLKTPRSVSTTITIGPLPEGGGESGGGEGGGEIGGGGDVEIGGGGESGEGGGGGFVDPNA